MSADSRPRLRKANPFLKSSRKPLTPDEILELDHALTNVFRIIRETRRLNPVASHIKFPSLPAVFSESIVIAAAAILFGPGWRCRYGGKECDVILEDAHGVQTKRVEVKATGHHAFQELKAKDLRADILVWVRFGRRYELGGGAIEVAIIEDPGKYVPNPRRLDVNRLNAIPGITTTQKVFRFESIEDLIGSPASSIPQV
jgi:hypothetical protein